MKIPIILFVAILSSVSLQSQSYIGAWISTDESPITLVLIEKEFKIIIDDGIFQQTYYGTYLIKNNTFFQHFFNGNNFSYTVSKPSNNSFNLYSVEENLNYHFQYVGESQLSEDDYSTILSETNFAQLIGTWKGEGEVLKFMGDGFMLHIPSDGGPQCALYSVLGKTLRLQFLDAMNDDFFFSAKIQNLSNGNMSLINNADNQKLSYYYSGEPQLNGSSENILYSTWLGISHRTNMDIIDAVDGTKNFIWKEVKDYAP